MSDPGPEAASGARRSRAALWWRVGCTVASIVAVQAMVFGVALAPITILWVLVASRLDGAAARMLAYSAMAAPSYVAFALLLMVVSPLASRLTGARCPEDARLPLAELPPPLLRWARAAVAAHLVRLVAGALFRGSPVWSAYLRLAGARVGRGVYVNTVDIADFDMLDLGDGVVIGADVHLSGHTVEAGVLTTGRVRLGRGVTVGIGSVIGIDVHVEEGAQVGALSFVPKHTRLAAGGVYAGIPVVRLPSRSVRAPAPVPWPGREESSAGAESPPIVR